MIEQLAPLVEALSKEKALESMHSKLTNGTGISEKSIKESNLNDTPEKKALNEMYDKIENFYPTRNQELAGKAHPETSVPYNYKLIEVDGDKKVGVFPEFAEFKKFETMLPEELEKSTDKVQQKYCNEQLRNALNSGELNKVEFTQEQLVQIENGDSPRNLVWHHKEIPRGKMELVDREIHSKTGHTGGREIWGGGKNYR